MSPSPLQLSVKVLTPERVQYEGPALAVSSFSSRGPFSLLPLHTNFIAIIRTRLSIFRTRTERVDIPVDVGIVVCRENRVEVYLGITPETAPSS
jgi:F0F1-type ATP synthase epsilon subunit